jgi:hypothetical protein
VCVDYFLNVETTFSPTIKARMKADALKEINPINTIPLFGISSPILIRTRERRKQIEVSKAIVMFVFFMLFVFCLCLCVVVV